MHGNGEQDKAGGTDMLTMAQHFDRLVCAHVGSSFDGELKYRGRAADALPSHPTLPKPPVEVYNFAANFRRLICARKLFSRRFFPGER
jgi:hypothetical protein